MLIKIPLTALIFFLLVFSQASELQNKSNSFQYIWRRLISDEGGRGLYHGNQMRCDFWFTGRWAYNWSWARGCVGGGVLVSWGAEKRQYGLHFVAQ